MVRRQGRQETEEQQDRYSIALIAGALAVGASAAATASTLTGLVGIPTRFLTPPITAVYKGAGRGGVAFATSSSPAESAVLETKGQEGVWKAQYVLNSARRLQQASKDGNLQEARKLEDRYFQQHVEASENRAEKAEAVDKAAKKHGPVLGWYAIRDQRTTAECREAHGKNFQAAVMPPIGYPGTVHTHCRCKPGKPHATSKTVYGIKPKYRKKAA